MHRYEKLSRMQTVTLPRRFSLALLLYYNLPKVDGQYNRLIKISTTNNTYG